MWSPTLFPRRIIIFQGVLTKFNFLTKFPHLEKIVDLIKDLKYEHQSTFPLWRRVKLNFRDRYRKPDIYSKNSSHYQVFSLNSQKLTLWCKKKIIPHPTLPLPTPPPPPSTPPPPTAPLLYIFSSGFCSPIWYRLSSQ